MENFIYVFDKAGRDSLLKLGYELLKSDESKNVFVFLNDGRPVNMFSDIKCVASNTLTF
jgi:hypothetical protein